MLTTSKSEVGYAGGDAHGGAASAGEAGGGMGRSPGMLTTSKSEVGYAGGDAHGGAASAGEAGGVALAAPRWGRGMGATARAIPPVAATHGAPCRRLRPDKVSSVAARLLAEGGEVRLLLGGYVPRSGDLVAVKVLSENPAYDRVELTTGRPARLGIGDVLVGALAARRALKGYVGDVPAELAVGDELALLNMGGTIGKCTGFNQGLGLPVRLEYLGAVLASDAPSQEPAVANVADGALPPALPMPGGPPVIAVAGSCMHAGKTRVATEMVRRFTSAGYKVAAGKTSGIACMKDTLEMRDNGAVKTLSFVDLGFASTVGVEDLAGVARSLIAHLGQGGADVIVLELGDGLLGGYNVGSVLDDPIVRRCLHALIFCAGDFVSAWGGIELLGRRGLAPDVISGAVTDSRMGVDYIRKELGFPAANAVTSGQTLFALVQAKLLAAAQASP